MRKPKESHPNKYKVDDKRKVIKQEPRKDSKSKRVNFDNERVSKFDKFEASKGQRSKMGNDPEWYNRNPELLKAGTSYPFSTVVGESLRGSIDGEAVPGIYTVFYDVALGGELESDVINTAKQSIYSYVVHANSRNTSYTDSDLMMLILAGNEIFRAISNAIRAYGCMHIYSQVNKYLGETLVEALGFSYPDLQKNYAQMWFDINRWIAMSAQIWIPNVFPFVKRQFWMNSNLYFDANSAKSQIYAYVPATFYKYNSTLSPKGGGLEAMSDRWLPSEIDMRITWNNYRNMMEEMFIALLSDEDRGLIFGDILKAYGADKLFALNEIPSDYRVAPVYVPEVLLQFNNIQFMGCGKNFMAAQKIEQDENGNIKKNWKYTGETKDAWHGPNVPILNFIDNPNPTGDDMMVASRLFCMGLYLNVTNKTYMPGSCGTEVALYGRIWILYANRMRKSITVVSCLKDTNPVSNVAAITAFDYAPLAYITKAEDQTIPTVTGGVNLQWIRTLGDIQNYLQMQITEISRMNAIAIFSEYAVPTL